MSQNYTFKLEDTHTSNKIAIKYGSYLNQGVQYPNLIAGSMVLDPHLCDNDHTEKQQINWAKQLLYNHLYMNPFY